MNKRSNTGVSILIALTLVLPCVAQTSQAEKGNPGAGAEDRPQYEKIWTAFKSGGGVTICPIARYAGADIPEPRYRSREFPAARQNQLR